MSKEIINNINHKNAEVTASKESIFFYIVQNIAPYLITSLTILIFAFSVTPFIGAINESDFPEESFVDEFANELLNGDQNDSLGLLTLSITLGLPLLYIFGQFIVGTGYFLLRLNPLHYLAKRNSLNSPSATLLENILLHRKLFINEDIVKETLTKNRLESLNQIEDYFVSQSHKFNPISIRHIDKMLSTKTLLIGEYSAFSILSLSQLGFIIFRLSNCVNFEDVFPHVLLMIITATLSLLSWYFFEANDLRIKEYMINILQEN